MYRDAEWSLSIENFNQILNLNSECLVDLPIFSRSLPGSTFSNLEYLVLRRSLRRREFATVFFFI